MQPAKLGPKRNIPAKRPRSSRTTICEGQKIRSQKEPKVRSQQEQFYQDPTAVLKQQYSRDDLNNTQSEIDMTKQAVGKHKQAFSTWKTNCATRGDPAGRVNPPDE
jgi:hypothetical protein